MRVVRGWVRGAERFNVKRRGFLGSIAALFASPAVPAATGLDVLEGQHVEVLSGGFVDPPIITVELYDSLGCHIGREFIVGFEQKNAFLRDTVR